MRNAAQRWGASDTATSRLLTQSNFASTQTLKSFRGLERENLTPPMDFVRDWLKAERKRSFAHVRWTFLGTMLVTIVTGLAFAAAYSLLG